MVIFEAKTKMMMTTASKIYLHATTKTLATFQMPIHILQQKVIMTVVRPPEMPIYTNHRIPSKVRYRNHQMPTIIDPPKITILKVNPVTTLVLNCIVAAIY